MATRLLIVDDESVIRQVICKTLRGLGFETVDSARGEEAVSLIQLSQFDAVLLDINMPGIGGIAACRAIRKVSPVLPVLMLTVRDSVDDKVAALEAGADDYITKPFAVRELVARVNAVLRRVHTPKEQGHTIIQIGEIELHTDQRLLLKRGEPVHLTPTEFAIMHHLMRHKGRPVTHRKLLNSVWGSEFHDNVEYLRTYMRQLRKKIEDDPTRPRYILTEPYVGYRFREEAPKVSFDTIVPQPDLTPSSAGFPEEFEWFGAS